MKSFAQDPPPPFRPIVVQELTNGELGSPTRPEVVDCNSEMTFSVKAETFGVGASEDNTFTWKVFGGRILNSTPNLTGAIDNKQKDYNSLNYQTSIATTTGWNADGYAELNLQWQNQDRSYAFIAVQQCSSVNGCSEDGWSIYYVEIIKGLEAFSIQLMDVTNVCPLEKMVSNIVIKGGDNWSFVITKEVDGILKGEYYYNNVIPADCQKILDPVTSAIIGYKYIIEIPTTLEDEGKTVFVQIKNFYVTLSELEGGNETVGTIVDPDGDGPLTSGKTGEVYELPKTSPIEHN